MQKSNKRSTVQQSKRDGVRKVSKVGDKLFIVRTYIMARNAPDALRKFRKQEPDDVYVSDDWKEGKNKELSTAIGFDNGMTDEDDV